MRSKVTRWFFCFIFGSVLWITSPLYLTPSYATISEPISPKLMAQAADADASDPTSISNSTEVTEKKTNP